MAASGCGWWVHGILLRRWSATTGTRGGFGTVVLCCGWDTSVADGGDQHRSRRGLFLVLLGLHLLFVLATSHVSASGSRAIAFIAFLAKKCEIYKIRFEH